MFFLLIKLFMKTLNQFILLAKSYFVKEMEFIYLTLFVNK